MDTLLLGCTHYPYLARVISDVMGPEVVLVSSADETAFALRGELERRQLLRAPDAGRPAVHRFLSSGDVAWFADLGRRLLGPELADARRWTPLDAPPDGAPHHDRHPLAAPPPAGDRRRELARRRNRRSTMSRPDGRQPDELRPISFERDFTTAAGGSVLVAFGATRVLCTASVDDDVPRWMKGKGRGWVTAEYSMLPGSSPERVDREAVRGKQGGRTMEIQRLIGRALRASCDLVLLGERQVVVDCDVLQADGGTRTASICAGYLALHDALARLIQDGKLREHPLRSLCAAISVGIVDSLPVLDLPYVEDSQAEVDMNVVMLAKPNGDDARFVEVQGTAEGVAFSRSELDDLLALAEGGLAELFALQAEYVSVPPGRRP